MAEGLQRRIEYSDLKFISSFAMEKILDFQTWEDPGEHARGNFRLLLSENGTDINSMNAPIQLLGQGNTAGALFSGYPEKVEIKEERGYRIADIQAVSGTILLDQKKSNRVFQKKVQTYMGIAGIVTADTEHSACILPGSDMRTGGTLIQYQETDWRFIIPAFTLDCRKVKKGNWEKSFPVISVLMGDIMQSVENALLIGKISFVMMLLRGQACRWGTG